MRPTHKSFWATIHSALALVFFTAPAFAAPINLLILGDSLTAGYGLPAQDGFQAQLAAALHAQGRHVALLDGAVSGDTSADAAARLAWLLAGPKPDAALVELGGNDGLRGLDPATMQHNLTYILDTLAAQKIPVLLSGMIAPPSYGPAYSAQFSAVFTSLSHRPGLLYDPFFLAGLPGHANLIQPDGIHPNAAGVTIEVTRLLPLIDRLLDEVAPPSSPAQKTPESPKRSAS